MLGKDADRNEYWHFKEDSDRLYVRKELTHTVEVAISEQDGEEESVEKIYETQTSVKWYYLDDE